MENIVKKLDSIATKLENQGLMKEALDLDIVSNTIEKMAIDVDKNQWTQILDTAVNIARSGNVKAVRDILNKGMPKFKAIINSYAGIKDDAGEVPIEKLRKALDLVMESLEQNNLVTAVRNLSEARNAVVETAYLINKAQTGGEHQIEMAPKLKRNFGPESLIFPAKR